MDADRLNRLTESVIGAAITVHKELGPGLLESTYEACLEYELKQRGIAVERQKELPVRYRGVVIDCGYRLDLLVEGAVILELKAVDRLDKIHEAQLHTYLRLTDLSVGLLMNFNVVRLVDGIKRIVRNLRENDSD